MRAVHRRDARFRRVVAAESGRCCCRRGAGRRSRPAAQAQPAAGAPEAYDFREMTPAIISKDGRLFMVTGSPGGRTIINTV
ncbi:MAG TPA: hypothetical protein VIK32_07750, partial [Candidatus Limnocylindrales bacterium]